MNATRSFSLLLQRLPKQKNVQDIKKVNIIINTDEGYKSAYLLRNGVYYNILNAVAAVDNDWITIYKGRNRLTYTTAGTMERLEFTLSYKNKYWGI